MEERRADELKERPLGELLRELSQETATLVRQEIALARAELAQTGKKAGIGAGMFGGAGAAGLMALGSLTACFILALNAAMPAWLAALIVALVYGAIAAVLALRGRDRIQEATPPAPQTIETVKEDAQWVKNPTRSAGR
ncbi:MAG TPA: phage holin family protein [Actinomycetota bacterium]|nr:phage holin family protein [Actinomycetota bacterium]